MDMKFTEDEKKERFSETKNLLEDTPEYPYGLQISLRPEDVHKLGLGDCDVQDMKKFMISAKVIEKSADPNYKGSDKVSLELQITDMELEGKKSAETIYE
jgi:hypothetical protein